MINYSSTNSALIRVLNLLPSQQGIVVIWEKECRANLYLYELNKESWILINQMPAVIGRNGMGKTQEGDQRSPSGVFSLGIAFGIAPLPEGIKYPYVMLTQHDYWVDDSQSSDYNKLVHYREGDPKEWQSAERLWEETICYRHAVVINYNYNREPGKGSAIFLHVWRDENTPTHGCTAVSESNMIRILQWLDPHQAPVFIQGTSEDINALAGLTLT